MAKPTSVYTLAPHQPFLDNVAAGVLAKYGHDPLLLSDVTLLVPDRETGFLLKQAFTEQLAGKPVILPKIDAPADMDDDTLSLKIADNAMLSSALMEIPPSVPRLHRQLILAQEILKLPGMASSVQKAVKLGGELGNFIDDVQRADVDLSTIDSLVPPAFRQQWKATAEFLKIITEIWPSHLEKLGMIDPEEHKNAVLRIRAAHWEQNPPSKPVIAVGFTDTTPAVLELLKSVAAMPKGAIVLQGVDLALDQKSWDMLGPVHPQFIFRKLLGELGAERGDVTEWSSLSSTPRAERAARGRQKLLREAMRPAGTAESWSRLSKATKGKYKSVANDDSSIPADALSGLDFITGGSPQEEASVIALKMRETLEIPGRTATLITPDRGLARRVSARLRQWQIDVDDGAGIPLSATSTGVFLLATARMAAEEFAPVPLLEALKHPLATLGDTKSNFRKKLATLEDMVLHGARPAAGTDGLTQALSAAFNRVSRRKGAAPEAQAERIETEAWLQNFTASGKDFFDRMASPTPQPFKDLLDSHIRFAENLAASDKEKGADRLWRNDDGVKATRFLSQLREASAHIPNLSGTDYLDLLQGLMGDVNVKARVAAHPNLKILNPAQAQFAKSDIIILGGLNDEVWPKGADENPWLSPDMIRKLGLPAADEAIGREALRFTQMAAHPNVLLARSIRSADAPAVASPFVTRLMMVLKGAGMEDVLAGKARLLDIHTAMHTPPDVNPIEPPEPRPPVSARPKQLPVTAVEALMRDPYTVYAKYILKLKPKAPLDASPGVSERGIFTHDALDTFVKKYPDTMPDNAYEELLKIGEETFKSRMNSPVVQSFWWPRFERIAKWFVRFEAERRDMTQTLKTEVEGKLEIDLGDETFTLTCIADRVDKGADDRLSLIDYKTGAVPSQKSVALGFSPQLTLEALIAYTGGFDGIDAADVGKLEYWKLSGGRPAADVTEVRGDLQVMVDEAREGLTNLVKAFNDEKTPYLATPKPDWAPRYNNYEHLSRVGEWSTVKKTNGSKTNKGSTARTTKTSRASKAGPKP